jgi:hypothetical protein
MAIWFVAAIPVLIMFFALAMERLEHRLRYLTTQDNRAVAENEVDKLPKVVPPTEGRARAGSGVSGALEAFRLRRLPRAAMVHSRRVRQRS